MSIKKNLLCSRKLRLQIFACCHPRKSGDPEKAVSVESRLRGGDSSKQNPTSSVFLAICSVMLIALPFTSPPSFASDEDDEEVKVLKQQMDLLSKKLDQIIKKRKAKKIGRKPAKSMSDHQPVDAVPLGAKEKSANLVAPPTKELPKPLVASGNDNVAVKLSGQINRLAAWRTNGQKQRLEHLDNNASASRFNITGEGKFNEDFSVQGVIEVELNDRNSNSSTKISEASEGGNTGSLRPRRIEALFISKRLGTLFVGQGSMAGDNTSEVDYSGTTGASNGSEGPFNFGGVQFYNRTTNSEDARIAADAFQNFDGLSRANRIRYDTPEFYGIMLGASHSNRDQIDAALKFAGKVKETKIGAAFAYSYPPFLKSGSNRRQNRQYNGSASILFANGLSVGAAGGLRKFTDIKLDSNNVRRRNAYFWFAKLGYQFKCFSIGQTALAIDAGRAHRHTLVETNFKKANSEQLLSYALTAVQNIDKVSTEIYMVLRAYELHRRKEEFKKVFVAALGTRIKF